MRCLDLQSPLKFISLKHLTMELTCWGNTKSVFQLAYLLEAAPRLEDLHFEMVGLDPISRPIGLEGIMDLPHYHLKTVCIAGFCGGDEGGVSSVHELYGSEEAKEKLAPLARDGVLTIL
ncbi:unnamed protein product [Urochloa humidicola]